MASTLLYPSCGMLTIDTTRLATLDRVLPSYQPGPYTYERLPHHMQPIAWGCIPPFRFYAIKSLYPFFDCIEMGDTPRRPYHPDKDIQVMVFLIPMFSDHMKCSDMKYVDPRLWATLIQIYEYLPPAFEVLTLPLSDIYLTRLQSIRSTINFTLITVLDLSGKAVVTDEVIDRLGGLLSLAVLDISRTNVTTWGIDKLAMCVSYDEEGDSTGPVKLRILSLRGCSGVADEVKPALEKFPLLSVLDLRGTSVRTTPFLGFSPIEDSEYRDLFFPYPSLSWIPALKVLFDNARIFASETPPHMLYVNQLVHPVSSVHQNSPAAFEGDKRAIFFPNDTQDVQPTHYIVDEKNAFNRTAKLNETFSYIAESHAPMSAEYKEKAAQKILEKHEEDARMLDFYACHSSRFHSITSRVTPHNDDNMGMFIRHPPAFDSVPHRSSKPKSKKVTKPDEIILSKRTKLPVGNCVNIPRIQLSVATGLLNMRGAKPEPYSQSKIALPPSRSQGSIILNRSISEQTSCFNPFRAKHEKQRSLSRTSVERSGSERVSTASIKSISAAAIPSPSLPNLNAPDTFNGKKRLKDKKAGFDMKAWATAKSKR